MLIWFLSSFWFSYSVPMIILQLRHGFQSFTYTCLIGSFIIFDNKSFFFFFFFRIQCFLYKDQKEWEGSKKLLQFISQGYFGQEFYYHRRLFFRRAAPTMRNERDRIIIWLIYSLEPFSQGGSVRTRSVFCFTSINNFSNDTGSLVL